MKISNVPAKDAMELIKKEPIAMIAIGSVEYHGAQAPLGTDYIIPDYIVNELSMRGYLSITSYTIWKLSVY